MIRWAVRSFEFWEAQVLRAWYLAGWLVSVATLGSLAYASPFLAIIAAAVALVRLLARRPSRGTFGTARWASFRDVQQAGCLSHGEGVLLGRACGLDPATARESVGALLLNRACHSYAAVLAARSRRPGARYFLSLPDPGPPHVAIFGPSGGGKTTCTALPYLLQSPESVVALDVKGELSRITAEHRARRFGHEIVIIDPFGISSLPRRRAAQFNPLSLCAQDSPTLVDEVRRLANAMVVRKKDEHQPFFNDASQVTIQASLAFLRAEALDGEANLNRLRDILTSPQLTEEMLTHMEGSEACSGLLRRLAGQVRWFQGQTAASVFASANTHLEFLDSLPIAHTLAATTFDLQKLLDRRMTIYLCLPVDRIREMRGLQRIIFTSLINHIFQAGESRTRRIRFVLDEAASLGEIEALYNALVFGRAFGIRLMFLFQSTSQIQLCFPDSKAADFQATVASMFCGANDYRTAQEISQWIGQTTVHSASEQRGVNWGSNQSGSARDYSSGSNSGGSRSTTYNEVGRALIQPEEVLQLPKSAALVLLPNVRPILVEKTPYYVQGLWRKRYLQRLVVALAAALSVAIFAVLFSIGGWIAALGLRDPRVQRFLQQLSEFLNSL